LYKEFCEQDRLWPRPPSAKNPYKKGAFRAQTASNFGSISTRPVTSTPTTEIANRSAYATVAPNSHPSPVSASKFNVPFDEGPMMATMDNVVEQVERIPEEIQKERGYHIIGKVKASEDQLRKILAVGDMRVWQ
jgi:hypothetical protein